ncbi:MAG: glutamate ligase domain-containing protein, partial [Pseudonocardiaceae bacterium]
VAMTGAGHRSWAVLGSLGELGPATEHAYQEIGALAVSLGVDRLVVVGEHAAGLYRAVTAGSAGSEPFLVSDVPAAVELLRNELTGGDVVLVKASRAAGLERIAEGLLEEHIR